nr:hypothetical protein L203_04510 [Cryptococcus depauperatus CBS 7841]
MYQYLTDDQHIKSNLLIEMIYSKIKLLSSRIIKARHKEFLAKHLPYDAGGPPIQDFSCVAKPIHSLLDKPWAPLFTNGFGLRALDLWRLDEIDLAEECLTGIDKDNYPD